MGSPREFVQIEERSPWLHFVLQHVPFYSWIAESFFQSGINFGLFLFLFFCFFRCFSCIYEMMECFFFFSQLIWLS